MTPAELDFKKALIEYIIHNQKSVLFPKSLETLEKLNIWQLVKIKDELDELNSSKN